jgi:hypothetical protein
MAESTHAAGDLLLFRCDVPVWPAYSVGAEGFGPFPVRNFQALDQLVLAMPGERPRF